MAVVTISLQNGKISVDLKKVQVSASGHQKVKWQCHDGDFQIEFKPGSVWPNPATSHTGSVWQAETGPFTAVGTTLSYAVTATGYETLDPEIEIIP